ncbi:hypothetical protein SCATT_47680 [Streptantibioticus cattleyicolor NRRL 8057 = DSM 46488]|uniref:Uncharacterized protein n=1 Tax=Streptantibioticus cattleyicolor (strain ATCC 35852 / DSM 46488 / JCM 4925 / NBRC 14057 / NRRL 8057) TaxID=1003195 RepID=G8WV55_STREN|nr:hypothetical protein SCATT_47680 [Streptantibioticus cattleyicolor NRRL 8057 = DSM 46488]
MCRRRPPRRCFRGAPATAWRLRRDYFVSRNFVSAYWKIGRGDEPLSSGGCREGSASG